MCQANQSHTLNKAERWNRKIAKITQGSID